MPQQIEIPGQGIVEFPDSMNDDQIREAAGKLSPQPKQAEQQIPQQPSRFPSTNVPADTAAEMTQRFDAAHPILAGVAKAFAGMVPTSIEQAKQMVTLPRPVQETTSGEQQRSSEELGQALRGEHGLEEQARSITGTALQALPLAHTLFGIGVGARPMAPRLPSLRETLFGDRTIKGAPETVAPPKTGGEINAEQPSNAQVQTRETPLGQQEGTASNVVQPSSSDNVVGETQRSEARGQVPAQAETVAEPQPAETGAAEPPAAPPTEPPAAGGGGEVPPEPLNPVKGSGKFKRSYGIDKLLGDLMEKIGASRESGALMGTNSSRKVLRDLTPEQQKDVGKYLVSERLKLETESHPQILNDAETTRIESDPAMSKAIETYRNEVEPEVENIHRQAGVSEEQIEPLQGQYISLIQKTEPQKGIGAFLRSRRMSSKTRFAKTATGGAPEYVTDVNEILGQAYGDALRQARKAEFFDAVNRKGISSTRDEADLPGELQHDLRAATERELQPIGIAAGARAFQRLTTGIQLTANPAELLNHMRRQLNILAAKPPVGESPIRRTLEAAVPYFGPKVGAFVRTITTDMSLPENMSVLQDIFNSGGGSSRSFSIYESNIPGVRKLQDATHKLLFGIPEGKGVSGWDLRMRVQLEKIRREAEGNVDPQRIREFANQIGQYGSHPDWIVKGLRAINPYAATTLPMRLTELKSAVGTSGLKGQGVAGQAETFLRGTGGTLLGLAAANYAISGKWPWENDKGHEFDLDTGVKDKDGKTVYMKFRVAAPELSRPVSTAALPNISRETTAKHPDYVAAFLTGLANQGLSLVSGPAQNTLLAALTGKAPYIVRAPGAPPEVLDVAKTEKGKSRGAEQIKRAAANLNPLGEALLEPTHEAPLPSPLNRIQEPIPGVKPFGSMFSSAYEKKKKSHVTAAQ